MSTKQISAKTNPMKDEDYYLAIKKIGKGDVLQHQRYNDLDKVILGLND